MDVGQLLRSLLNEAQPGEPKTLELKVGQIVKGLVLQLLAGQDALINIGGVQVKAHLETPLKQGEVTMLQVQPDSTNGQITLKPMANSTVLIADESLADVLSNMGLKDTVANRQIVQTMHQENISLTKENMQAFAKVVLANPANAVPEQWLQSTLLAVKNNLPITVETVSALHQVVYGAPINQQLDQLAKQLNAAQTNPALSKEVSDLITQIKSQLSQLQAASSQAFQSPLSEEQTSSKPTVTTTNIINTPINTNQSAKDQLISNTVSLSGTEQSTTAKALGAIGNQLPQSNPPIVAQGESTVKNAADGKPTNPVAADEANKSVKLPLTNAETVKLASTNNETTVNRTQQASQTETPQWISKWLKSLGVEHEQQLFKALDKAPGLDKQGHLIQKLVLEPEFTIEGNRTPVEAAKQVVTDSLKAALLQLNSMDDTPPALKESAQQLLQQITGQQLLLSPDRTSMFSHITMMIPMNNEQGQQTAAVHIQSRKGSRGEIDANNCRLVFDLQMKSIGDTLVDVQVFNKIVSVHVHNDHDFVANLLEGSRDEIAASLQNVGYQFLSLKISPFPEDVSEQAALTKDSRNANVSSYASKPYKGVDLRV
ncbi:hypothetical protein EHS13_15645 [Paenibacillus psychroresistens]|uniref:Flagellar hook-length control protein FliK n=1 Tax=Paenibacillus psychroresistens TaxID=1778678 RepID=A0A6B8RLG8_9BACL|nr:hypothetical protein [Paenibacillus psychroresistens]QGQ96208.1 hypothetical protein EHS13_15645 [Paenibacillus psychroresistens]